MERVISRADLLSPAGTPDPETNTEPTAQARPQKFKFVTKTSEADNPPLVAEDNEDLLEFRLFAPTSATGNASKIRLRSPTPQTTAPGFVVHERNLNYYFAEPSKSAEKGNYESAALSGAEVDALSRTPWPGSAYPWKVLHVSIQGRRKSSLSTDKGAAPAPAPASASAAKRKQPGKKARIQIRVKLAAQRAESDKQQTDAKAREIADREKRVRLNRAKTLRKRAREKARKAGAAKDGSDGDGD
ncbi:hypothetical protein LTR17_015278 [Elasticomyces elasticus]|nr:hypothetical protein LTR17_015278 [Elasticomyces elasticus]